MTKLEPINIFIGYDEREPIAFHVLTHSILSRATCPVRINPLRLDMLKGLYWRQDRGSTDFTFSRFLVPKLSNYEGVSVFMDCDMLCQTDIGNLLIEIDDPSRRDAGVLVCKHDYVPKESTKFLGQSQTAYPKKNWSSFMVFRNKHCKDLTTAFVNTASAMDLHRFNWIDESKVVGLPLDWNWLVGEYTDNKKARVFHWTNGGPWFEETKNAPHADVWLAELEKMHGPTTSDTP